MHFPEDFNEPLNTRFAVCEAKGLGYYTYKRDDREGCQLILPAGSTLKLKREPDNDNDSNAIKLISPFISRPGNGFMIGYVERSIAAILAPLMDAGAEFTAYNIEEISGRWTASIMICGDVPESLYAPSIERQIAAYERDIAPKQAAPKRDDTMPRRRQVIAAIAAELLARLPKELVFTLKSPEGRQESKAFWDRYGYRVPKLAKPVGTASGVYGTCYELYAFEDVVPKRPTNIASRASAYAIRYGKGGRNYYQPERNDPLYTLRYLVQDYESRVESGSIERSPYDAWFYTQ